MKKDNFCECGKRICSVSVRCKSCSNRVRFVSEETKHKFSLSKLGENNPAKRPDVRKKLCESKVGERCYWLNKSHTKETKRKQSMRKIGDLNPAKRPEVREKIRESMIKAFSERPEMVERMRLQRSNQVFPLKDTKIEVKIQNYLKEIGLEFFTHQYIGDIKNSYQCDILVPSLGLVIECDGDYWHQYPIGRDIDCIRTSELLAKGFKVLRLWEHEIKKLTLEEFKQKIDVQVGV